MMVIKMLTTMIRIIKTIMTTCIAFYEYMNIC